MFALPTLPRGVPADAETRSIAPSEEPVGIIIRPGPAVGLPRVSLSAALAAART